MSTQGDKLLDAPLAKVGGKGLFIKELDRKINMDESVIAEVTRETVERIAESHRGHVEALAGAGDTGAVFRLRIPHLVRGAAA